MRTSFVQRRLCCCALFLAATFFPLLAGAQTKPLITQPVDPAKRQTLQNSMHPLVKHATDLGRADASLPMKDMILLLHSPAQQPVQANQSIIDQYLASVHNPHSANYQKWLTPEQYAQKFGTADADVKIVSEWLQSSGLTVEQVARGKNWIRFSGTAAQIESAFQTEIHQYSLAKDPAGTKRIANATNISVPAAIAPAVSGIVSMSSFFTTPQHTVPQKLVRDASGKLTVVANANVATRPSTGAKPALTETGTQVTNFITPGDFSTIYNSAPVVSSDINGSGVSIAVVGRSDINISDVEAFRTLFNLPFNDPTITYANTDPGDVSGDDVEATLDVEWSAAVAPLAKINLVLGATTATTDGVDIASSYIVDNVTAPIMTVSFGQCEANEPDSEIAFYHTLWQQAAAEGITVFVATGDSGASSCNDSDEASTVYGFGVSALASTPYNVAVGGTEFNDLSAQNTFWSLTNAPNQSSATGYIPEAAWNESCAAEVAPGQSNCLFAPYDIDSSAGGGGASSCISRTWDDYGDEWCASGYAKPSWQQGSGVPSDGVRDLPDVALASAAEHDPFVFCIQGACQWTTNSDGSITLQSAATVGGTSVASPSMAGIMALIEQKAGGPQGIANYELYSLAANQAAGSCNSSTRTDPTQSSACVFNDVTLGSNAVPCISPSQDCGGTDQPVQVGVADYPALFPPNALMDGQSAAAGFDLATGLGSVNIANLVNAWGTYKQSPSTTTLSLSQTTFQHGTPITLSGAVSAGSGTGTPTGEVAIQVSNSQGYVLSIPITAGAFNTSSIDLPGGTYSITAVYSGDSTFAQSTSAPVSVTVTPESSTLTATSWAYSILRFRGGTELLQLSTGLLDYPWYLQFNVAGNSGSVAATGTVAVTVNGKPLGTYPVASQGLVYIDCGAGTACDFPVGTLNITANYSGDKSFSASSTTYQFNVAQGHPQINTSANNETPIANATVVGYVTFSTTDPAYPPTGSVTLTRDDTGATLGTGTLDKTGTATIPFNAGSGTYNLIATWSGDANYIAATPGVTTGIQTESNPGTIPVNLSLKLGGSTFSLGQSTTFSVAVTPTQSNSATPIGYVDLWLNNGAVSPFAGLEGALPAPITIALSGGKATGTIPWNTAGAQSVYAVYEGDNNFAGATSSTIPVTVAQAAPLIAVQPVSGYAAAGATTSVTALLGNSTASASVPMPTGTIQFYNSLNGAAPTPLGLPIGFTTGNGGSVLATLAPVLPQGSNVVTATYSGDANWKSVTSAPSTPIVVTTPDFSLTPPSGTISVTAGQTATIPFSTQSILGYNTPITITCGTVPAGVTCTGATIAPGASGTVTLTTTAPGIGAQTQTTSRNNNPLLPISGALSLAGLAMLFLPHRLIFRHLAVVLLAMGIAAGFSGCGSSGSTPAPAFTLTSSSTQVASGTSVTFTASAQSSGASDGTITFYADHAPLGQAVPLTNRSATLSTSSLSVGTHAITAVYSDAGGGLSSSSSDTLEQEVTGSFTLVLTGTAGQNTHSVSVPATLN